MDWNPLNWSTIDIVFNAMIMMFWFAVWAPTYGDTIFNPYLARLSSATDILLLQLRRFLFGLPYRSLAFFLVVILIVARGLVTATGSGSTLHVGFLTYISGQGIPSCLLFSLLSFLIFLFNVWGLSLIYAPAETSSDFDHVPNAIYNLARPFSLVFAGLRPLLLLVFGIVLVTLLVHFASSIEALPAFTFSSILHFLLKASILVLAEWINLLRALVIAMVLLIVGSWLFLLSASERYSYLCQEWIHALLGPLRRYPIRMGMLDLTPLVFVLVLTFLHRYLYLILIRSYEGIPP